MKTKKKGNNWTAYYDPDTNRYFAEIMYTSREAVKNTIMRSRRKYMTGWDHLAMMLKMNA